MDTKIRILDGIKFNIIDDERIPFKMRMTLNGKAYQTMSKQTYKKVSKSDKHLGFIIGSINESEKTFLLQRDLFSIVLNDDINFINRISNKFHIFDKDDYRNRWIYLFIYCIKTFLKNKNVRQDVEELSRIVNFGFIDIYDEYKKLH